MPCRSKPGRIQILVVWAILSTAPTALAQRYLIADGQTDTYTLINRTLGGTAVETPDCSHRDFGPHITQEFDQDLGRYTFVFHIHVVPDNDRCVAFDRQRNEIKTYGPSPAYLKGFTVTPSPSVGSSSSMAPFSHPRALPIFTRSRRATAMQIRQSSLSRRGLRALTGSS